MDVDRVPHIITFTLNSETSVSEGAESRIAQWFVRMFWWCSRSTAPRLVRYFGQILPVTPRLDSLAADGVAFTEAPLVQQKAGFLPWAAEIKA